MEFVAQLENALKTEKNTDNAQIMAAYMKNNFPFLGIKTPQRRAIFTTWSKQNHLFIKQNYQEISWHLFTLPEREFHYCGIEIFIKYSKNHFNENDYLLIEKWLTKNSWWDSVDTLAKYALGNYLKQFPEQTEQVIERFSNAKNMWLNRSAIIFQLGYKKETNYDLLKSECEKHKHSNEFFIKKAIGWALREYGQYNPTAVLNYVQNTNLKNLSQKEALRKILKLV